MFAPNCPCNGLCSLSRSFGETIREARKSKKQGKSPAEILKRLYMETAL